MFSSYNTIKFVKVENRTLACIYNILFLALVVYVIGVTIIWNKGYQKVGEPLGTTSAKVKGTALIKNGTEDLVYNSDDFVTPSAEADALFVTTKYIFTPQEQTTCEGTKKVGKCEDGCKEGKLNWAGFGKTTGECPDGYEFCEVQTWCPIETEDNSIEVGNVENWTIFFKVNIEFPEFGVSKTNALAKDGKKPIKGYNLFTLREIVEMAGANWTQAADTGAIIQFTTTFDCNLDKKDEADQCNPVYKAHRIDDVSGTISPGFNFRSVAYNGQMEERLLMKRWGIRIIFTIDGEAGKFDVFAMLLTLGAGVGFFGIATVVCDLLLEYWQDSKGLYEAQKYEIDPYHDSDSRLLPNTYQQDQAI